MKRPAMALTWRDGLFIGHAVAAVLLALYLVLAGASGVRLDAAPAAIERAAETSGPAAPREESTGEPRDVPVDLIKRRIEMEQLSDHPAEWAEPLQAAP